QGLDELLQPLLQVSVIPALRSHRSEAGAMGSAQVPQIGGKADTGPRMAEESGQPATPAVCSLARLWESRGTDNGSCMTGDCHVQFCEGLWVKSPGSTLFERNRARLPDRSFKSARTR